MNILAERIAERRKSLDLSQEQVSERSGIGQAQISRYERGDASPTAGVLSALADALETSADYLLGKTDDPTPSALRVAEHNLSEIELKVIDAWRNEDWKEVMRLMSARSAHGTS